MITITEIFKTIQGEHYSAFFFTPSIYKNAKSYIFQHPEFIIKVNKSNFKNNFTEVDDLLKSGKQGYSIVNYETGYLFEEKFSKLVPQKDTLAEFVFFNSKNLSVINSNDINFDFIFNYKIKNFRLNTSKKKYLNAIRKIKSYIKNGDTYQVNYTVKGKFNFDGELSSLFQNLIFNQSAKYIAVINLPDKFIISISPELFFELNKTKIFTKPMKGTLVRGCNLKEDIEKMNFIKSNEKDKAENVMIVDLIRNDLGKISLFGSVDVPKLFEIEKYETLFQMTSQVQSRIKNNIKFSDLLKNLFPSGSVTGAPKIRTMEIINEIEKDKRNIYTGSIGLLLKNRIIFNIAIRTLVIKKNNMTGEIGLGSGILWDSKPNKEYNEVLLKSKFITSPVSYFEIFETALIKNGKMIFFNEHLERLKNTADFFLFKYDEKKIKNKIITTIKSLDVNKFYKIKILISKYGNVSIIIKELSELPEKIKVILSSFRIDTKNKFQYFKTTHRKLYDKEYKKFSSKGFYDVIYLNEKNEVTEGAISNLFLKIGNYLLTPSINSGILAGIYRNFMLNQNPDIQEKNITIKDLMKADEIYLTNSLRGKIKIDELHLGNGKFISY